MLSQNMFINSFFDFLKFLNTSYTFESWISQYACLNMHVSMSAFQCAYFFIFFVSTLYTLKNCSFPNIEETFKKSVESNFHPGLGKSLCYLLKIFKKIQLEKIIDFQDLKKCFCNKIFTDPWKAFLLISETFLCFMICFFS